MEATKMAQATQRPETQSGQSGIGVDAQGGAVIDPTKNVESLVNAESEKHELLRAADNRFIDAELKAAEKLQNFAREAESKFQSFARESEARMQTWMRDAETRRVDQLSTQAKEFQNTIRDMLAESVRTTSTLVSTQLVQIQATFDTRVSKLEAYQFTQAGRSSVADPAMADAMVRLTATLADLRTTQDTALARMTAALSTIQANESRVGGSTMGKSDSNARLLSVVMAVAAVASPVIAILVTIMAMRGR